MKIIQTFATDNFDDNVNFALNTQQLFFHYLSAQSIRKVYGDDQEFILVTDTKGKELATIYGFPYSSISTALDDYPFNRPIGLSGYKGYTLSLYPDDDVIHVDNDVVIKKVLPDFTDTIVQSNEGNMLEYVPETAWHIALAEAVELTLPPVIRNRLTSVYNPGVIGFKASSIIREEYIETHNEYLDKNTVLLRNLSVEVLDNLPPYATQYINTLLEESVLFNLCIDNNITPTEVLDVDVVGAVPVYTPDSPTNPEYFSSLRDRSNNFHTELGYLHFFMLKRNTAEKHRLLNYLGNMNSDSTTTFIPFVSETIQAFLSSRYGLSINPSIEEINTVIKLIILT